MRPVEPAVAALVALVAGVVLAVASPIVPPTADAQELPLLDPAVPEPRAVVALDRIDATVPSGAAVNWSLLVEHTDQQRWESVEVVAELHAALGSRSALRAALDGGQVPRRLRRTVTEVGTLEPGALVRVSGDVPLAGAALGGPDTAVHPLRLRLLVDGEELGRVDTAFVRVGAAPSATLATTLVWELTAPPARDPVGDVAALLDPLTRDGGRLDTLLRGLEGLLPDPPPPVGPSGDPSGVPSDGAAPTPTGPPAEVAPFARAVALAVPPHLVEDLARRAADAVARADADPDPAAVRAAALLERLRTVVGAMPAGPLATPYADADVARLLVSGPTLQALAPRALLESDERTAALLGRLTGPAALPGTPLTAAMLDLLPARTVVVPYGAIEGPDLVLDIPLEEPVRTLRSPTGRRVTALVGDPFLTDALAASTRARPGDPVRAAQEVLVRTAMVHLEAPGREGRSLVILPPPAFDPDPRFVDELLVRLAAAPWLTPTGPEATVAATTSRIPTRLADVDVAPLPPRLRDALVATSDDLELLVDTVDLSAGGGDGAIPVGARTLREAADELLRATSRSLRGPATAVGLLDGVRAGVADTLGEIVVTIDEVTLTDREGTVPLTLSHDGAVPLRTRVTLTGPAALAWTDGRVREVTFAAVDERAFEVPVRAGATGRFAVTVEVTDPSGTRVFAREVAGVRATALAGPALVAIGAVVLVLVVIGTVRQRRRGLAWPPAARAAALEQDVGTR